jgi:hypothetical protein
MAAAEQPVYGQYDPASGGYTAIGGPQINSIKMIGTVTSGPPIIINPETGKPYPPGFIPNEQAKGTFELWTMGSSLAENNKLQTARLREITRAAIEKGIRPYEEKLVNELNKGVDSYEQAVMTFGTAFGKDPGKAVSNLLGGGAAQLAGGATKIGSQAIQSGQQLAGQALKSGQQLAGQVSASFGGGTPQAKFNSGSGGGMTSALVSKAPERALTGGTGPVFTSGARRN